MRSPHGPGRGPPLFSGASGSGSTVYLTPLASRSKYKDCPPRRVTSRVADMRFQPTVIFALVTAFATAAAGRADVVYMKDGFRLDGKVRREATLIIDPLNGQAIPVFKGS